MQHVDYDAGDEFGRVSYDGEVHDFLPSGFGIMTCRHNM